VVSGSDLGLDAAPITTQKTKIHPNSVGC